MGSRVTRCEPIQGVFYINLSAPNESTLCLCCASEIWSWLMPTFSIHTLDSSSQSGIREEQSAIHFIHSPQKALRANNVTVDLSPVFPVTNSKGKLFGQQHTGIGERSLNWAEGFTYRVPYWFPAHILSTFSLHSMLYLRTIRYHENWISIPLVNEWGIKVKRPLSSQSLSVRPPASGD